MIGQKGAQFIDIPKEIEKVTAATYLCLGSSQCIAAYNEKYLYFMEFSDTMSINYSTFAISNIKNVIALVKGYLVVTCEENKIWLLEVKKDDRPVEQGAQNPQGGPEKERGGLFIQCFLKDSPYSSFFIREVTANMIELQIFANGLINDSKSILIYQFTINQKVGMMAYIVDKQYKIIKTNRKQLYGSKTYYDPSTHQLIKFKSFSDSQLQAKPLPASCSIVIPTCKTEQYYGITKSIEMVNLQNPSNKKKLKEIFAGLNTSRCLCHINYLLVENLQLGKVYLYSFEENMKYSLVYEEEAGFVWSIGFNGRLIGVDRAGGRIKICRQAKIDQVGSIGLFNQPEKKIIPQETQIAEGSKINEFNKGTKTDFEKKSDLVANMTPQQQEKKQQKKVFKPTKIISRNKVSVSKEVTTDNEQKRQSLSESISEETAERKQIETQQAKRQISQKQEPDVVHQPPVDSDEKEDSSEKSSGTEETTNDVNFSEKSNETDGSQNQNQQQDEKEESSNQNQASKKQASSEAMNSPFFSQSPFLKKPPFCAPQKSPFSNPQNNFSRLPETNNVGKIPPPPFSFMNPNNPSPLFRFSHPQTAKPNTTTTQTKETQTEAIVFEDKKFEEFKQQEFNIKEQPKISQEHLCEPLFERYSKQINKIEKQLSSVSASFDEKISKVPQIIEENMKTFEKGIFVTEDNKQGMLQLDSITNELNKKTQANISDYMSKKLTTRVNSYFKHIMNDTKKIYDDTYKFYNDRKKETVVSLQAHFQEQEHLINQIRELSGGLMLSVESSINEGEETHALMLREWSVMKSGMQEKLQKNFEALEQFTHQKSDTKKTAILDELIQIKDYLKARQQKPQKKPEKPRKTQKKQQQEQTKKNSKRQLPKKSKKSKPTNREYKIESRY